MSTMVSADQPEATACCSHDAYLSSSSTIRKRLLRDSSIYSSVNLMRTAARCSTALPSRITGW